MAQGCTRGLGLADVGLPGELNCYIYWACTSTSSLNTLALHSSWHLMPRKIMQVTSFQTTHATAMLTHVKHNRHNIARGVQALFSRVSLPSCGSLSYCHSRALSVPKPSWILSTSPNLLAKQLGRCLADHHGLAPLLEPPR